MAWAAGRPRASWRPIWRSWRRPWPGAGAARTRGRIYPSPRRPAMNAVVKDRSAVPALKDSKLFRDQAYLDGAWVEADSKKRFDVDNPGTGAIVGSVPDMGTAE